MPNTLPTKTADDLGTPLTNARAPRTNELSAVNLERIKDHIIALATELGLRNGSTPNSVWAALAAAAQALQHTLDATRAPGPGDDESAGYSTGSLWMWPTESRVWVYLVVPGLGADWLELQTAIEPADVLHDALGEPTVDGDLVRSGGAYAVRRAVVGAIVPPTATDDETQGFAIGSTWHDSAAGALYVCLDASTAAAVWRRIDGGGLTIVAPSPPGAESPINGNSDAGATAIQYFSPADEPADPAVSGPYYLRFRNTTTDATEHVIVVRRAGALRILLTPLQATFSAGSAVIAYAGPATAGGDALVSRIPAAPLDTTAGSGTSTAAAAADHVHPVPNAALIPYGGGGDISAMNVGDALAELGASRPGEATTSTAGLMSALDKDLLYQRKQRVLLFQDEFVDNIVNRWGTAVTGAGAAVTLATAAGANPCGRCQLSTGTTSTGVAQLRTAINFAYTSRTDEVYFDTVVGLSQLADGVDDFKVYVSGMYSPGSFSVGYAFVYDPAVSPNWLLARFGGGGIAASVNTGVPVTGGTAPTYGGEKRLTTVYDKANDRVQGYIDGALVATLTGIGNVNAVYYVPAVIEKTLGTTSVSLVVDYTRCAVTPSAGMRA